jgi:hypothetical protein
MAKIGGEMAKIGGEMAKGEVGKGEMGINHWDRTYATNFPHQSGHSWFAHKNVARLA